MKIKDVFKNKGVSFSFEVFPPKATSPVSTIYSTLEDLKDLNPDFISVTYGAGGSLTGNRTLELSALVKEKYNIEALAHLTCIGATKDQIKHILDDFKEHNIENILALRGDIPTGEKISGDFKYASDLIKFIKENGDFNIAAACYPEGHVKGRNLDVDMEHLKLKEEAGASHFISQLFFDNNHFYNFLEKKEKYNIKAPIEAGIMPVINKKQIERIGSLCGVEIPQKFIKIMEKYEHDQNALRDAGIAYAVEQIVDLISTGIDGVHLYTMNNPYVAKKITGSISSILSSINRRDAV